MADPTASAAAPGPGTGETSLAEPGTTFDSTTAAGATPTSSQRLSTTSVTDEEVKNTSPPRLPDGGDARAATGAAAVHGDAGSVGGEVTAATPPRGRWSPGARAALAAFAGSDVYDDIISGEDPPQSSSVSEAEAERVVVRAFTLCRRYGERVMDRVEHTGELLHQAMEGVFASSGRTSTTDLVSVATQYRSQRLKIERDAARQRVRELEAQIASYSSVGSSKMAELRADLVLTKASFERERLRSEKLQRQTNDRETAIITAKRQIAGDHRIARRNEEALRTLREELAVLKKTPAADPVQLAAFLSKNTSSVGDCGRLTALIRSANTGTLEPAAADTELHVERRGSSAATATPTPSISGSSAGTPSKAAATLAGLAAATPPNPYVAAAGARLLQFMPRDDRHSVLPDSALTLPRGMQIGDLPPAVLELMRNGDSYDDAVADLAGDHPVHTRFRDDPLIEVLAELMRRRELADAHWAEDVPQTYLDRAWVLSNMPALQSTKRTGSPSRSHPSPPAKSARPPTPSPSGKQRSLCFSAVESSDESSDEDEEEYEYGAGSTDPYTYTPPGGAAYGTSQQASYSSSPAQSTRGASHRPSGASSAPPSSVVDLSGDVEKEGDSEEEQEPKSTPVTPYAGTPSRTKPKAFGIEVFPSSDPGLPEFVFLTFQTGEAAQLRDRWESGPYRQLLSTVPWDVMFERRHTLLYYHRISRLHADVLAWVSGLVKAMIEHRQAFWERTHWMNIPDSSLQHRERKKRADALRFVAKRLVKAEKKLRDRNLITTWFWRGEPALWSPPPAPMT
ncbi:hypothetical protein BBJ28_00024325 [Nothophytophthora sp. Chile5]|nr:hypothetical protein BBJ28_00024325 [Nothophytophthora sp. Chile5]